MRRSGTAWLTDGQISRLAAVNRGIPRVDDGRPSPQDSPARQTSQLLIDAIAEDVPAFLAELNWNAHSFSAVARFVAEDDELVFRIADGPFGRQLLESFANSLSAQALIDEAKLSYAFHVPRLHADAESLRSVVSGMDAGVAGTAQTPAPEVHRLANLIQAYAAIREGEWPEGKAFIGLDGEMTTDNNSAGVLVRTALETSPSVCAGLALDARTVTAIGRLIMLDGPDEMGIGKLLRESSEGTDLFVEGVADFGASYVRELPAILQELETGERPQGGEHPGLLG